jgi:hypothetical protein
MLQQVWFHNLDQMSHNPCAIFERTHKNDSMMIYTHIQIEMGKDCSKVLLL